MTLAQTIADALIQADRTWQFPSFGGDHALNAYHAHRAKAVEDAIEKHALIEMQALVAALQGDIIDLKQRVTRMSDVLTQAIDDLTTVVGTIGQKLGEAVTAIVGQIHSETEQLVAHLGNPSGVNPDEVTASASRITALKDNLNSTVANIVQQMNDSVSQAQASITAAQPAPQPSTAAPGAQVAAAPAAPAPAAADATDPAAPQSGA
jgi:malate synthase